jgi:hypothetical protein
MSTGGASGEAITIRNCWVVLEELPPHPNIETIARKNATTPTRLRKFSPPVQVVVYQKLRNSGNRMRRMPNNDVPRISFSGLQLKSTCFSLAPA